MSGNPKQCFHLQDPDDVFKGSTKLIQYQWHAFSSSKIFDVPDKDEDEECDDEEMIMNGQKLH